VSPERRIPNPGRIITFTTDFGTGDTYAGQLRGAALSVCPDAILADLTHDVPPHDVAAGAFLFQSGYRAFPHGTIHVVVVDPGVGTARRGVAVRTDRYYFVAPDNGVLSRVMDEEPIECAHVLEAARYRRDFVSATFEGRDVFAPAAAWIARGVDLANFGPPAGDLVRLPPPPRIEAGRPSRVRVLYVDRFGNVVLDVNRAALEPLLAPPAGRGLSVHAPRGSVSELRRTYSEGAGSGPFLLFGSSDQLEVAVRSGRAAEALGLAPGAEVELRVV
jgi:S-adenosylmethionine hydrolase